MPKTINIAGLSSITVYMNGDEASITPGLYRSYHIHHMSGTGRLVEIAEFGNGLRVRELGDQHTENLNMVGPWLQVNYLVKITKDSFTPASFTNATCSLDKGCVVGYFEEETADDCGCWAYYAASCNYELADDKSAIVRAPRSINLINLNCFEIVHDAIFPVFNLDNKFCVEPTIHAIEIHKASSIKIKEEVLL